MKKYFMRQYWWLSLLINNAFIFNSGRNEPLPICLRQVESVCARFSQKVCNFVKFSEKQTLEKLIVSENTLKLVDFCSYNTMLLTF